ncbi:hypothetical protein HanXRQr2_Chr11g0485251 [Helianthus annuus]|uniref:Uncharacterized protein n=1 Tax=Helianthus annuus TaxID=4232 RepID=A0A251TDT6_HELAN|nr:hypothetical protein HanXRQr2_Chr11g0485251 [Helianthus annuus]
MTDFDGQKLRYVVRRINRVVRERIGSVCSNKMGKTWVYPMVMNGFSNTSGKEGKFSISKG